MAEEQISDLLSDNSSYGQSVAISASKLQSLQNIAAGEVTSYDSSALKGKMALFLLAHADKVMDTVAPLETLRDELVIKYAERVQERMEDPELTPGAVAKMIGDIQQMNTYSFNMLKSLLDADKLQTLINIDMSNNVNNTQINNEMPLETASSRARVLRALQLLNKLQDEEDSSESNVES